MKKVISALTLLAFLFCSFTVGVQAEDSPVYTVPEMKKADLADSVDEDTAAIVFDGDSAVTDGTGAEYADHVLSITKEGTYLLSGTSENAQVLVSVSKDEKVRLILNSLTLTCTFGPCIRIDSADKVTVTLAEGSENSLTDTENYTLADGEDEPNACLYSKDDLSVNGTGALVINANYKHGINCKDDLKIVNGNITVHSKGDGVRGKDSVLIADGSLTINAESDGIQSSNDSDSGRGFVCITGGVVDITAAKDAVQGAQGLIVEGGTVSIVTGNGSSVLSSATRDSFFQRGGWGSQSGWDRSFSTETDSVSAKGLKSDGILVIAGGDITADTEDDCLHAAQAITVSGGTLTLSSGDDGVHSDTSLLVSGGVINVLVSYEGLEAPAATVSGGTLHINASDDGINCAGGDDETVSAGDSWGGSFGGMMADANASNVMRFTGGFTYVNAGGDGLDSNGYIYMEGGTVLVDGPTDSANSALDSGYSIVVSGGTLAAAGAAGMVETPDNSSTQPCVVLYTSQNGGTDTALLDTDGNLVFAYTPSKAYGCVIISSPDLTLNGTYQAVAGASIEGDSEDGLVVSGTCSGGQTVGSLTLTGTVVNVGSGSGYPQWGGGNQQHGGGFQQSDGSAQPEDGFQESDGGAQPGGGTQQPGGGSRRPGGGRGR